MFLAETKKMLAKGMIETFDGDYPVAEFQNLRVSGEFPVLEQDYPSIWVDFTPTGPLKNAGVNHIEFDEGAEGFWTPPIQRWTFNGSAQFTCLALSNAQRDQMFDEVVKVLAFARVNPSRSAFRDQIESYEFIGMDFDWESISVMGMAETPGTPWGTDDYMYEVTLSLSAIGEFTSSTEGEDLPALSAIEVYEYSDREEEPAIPGGGEWQ